ncbi:LysR family transcriptional regulator [Streptomyces sp. TRM 70361]|uniref:LysR family transcriptional regulator n=1 Tax=Streptomyces sp. TRM 70361 TaxID=3116553 RepID=UPI002E7C16A6|nr:LysR family transcriptional regulator [Streptomyces sp. TRM 70361]MEE1943021.1 LysR family transcriptional regulator [Streptomyces sp. TRM 70361]
MDLKELSAFLEVVERGSFTKAAHRLELAQPTVTARIKSLERSVGTSLIVRGAHGARLTSAGRRFHRYASRIVRLSEAARSAVDGAAGQSASLVIGAADCLAAYRLVPLIEYMHLRHPELEVAFSGLLDEPWAELSGGRLDCALFVGPRLQRGDIAHRVLCRERLTLVAHPAYPVAARNRMEDGDLKGRTMVCANRGGYQEALERHLAVQGLDVPALAVGSVDAVKRSVADGVGVAVLPAVCVADEVRAGMLQRIDWEPGFEVFAQCAWRRDLADDPAFRVMLATAVQLTAENTPAAAVRRERPARTARRHPHLTSHTSSAR